jgi:hypothetical protein
MMDCMYMETALNYISHSALIVDVFLA